MFIVLLGICIHVVNITQVYQAQTGAFDQAWRAQWSIVTTPPKSPMLLNFMGLTKHDSNSGIKYVMADTILQASTRLVYILSK